MDHIWIKNEAKGKNIEILGWEFEMIKLFNQHFFIFAEELLLKSKGQAFKKAQWPHKCIFRDEQPSLQFSPLIFLATKLSEALKSRYLNNDRHEK